MTTDELPRMSVEERDALHPMTMDDIDLSRLRIDIYRHATAGLNGTDVGCVRITHVPTGITVESNDECSVRENKMKAFKLLKEALEEPNMS